MAQDDATAWVTIAAKDEGAKERPAWVSLMGVAILAFWVVITAGQVWLLVARVLGRVEP